MDGFSDAVSITAVSTKKKLYLYGMALFHYDKEIETGRNPTAACGRLREDNFERNTSNALRYKQAVRQCFCGAVLN